MIIACESSDKVLNEHVERYFTHCYSGDLKKKMAGCPARRKPARHMAFSCILDYLMLLNWKKRSPEPSLTETNGIYQFFCEIIYFNQ